MSRLVWNYVLEKAVELEDEKIEYTALEESLWDNWGREDPEDEPV